MLAAIAIYFVVVTAISAGFTYALVRRPILMDRPNTRSSHERPTPRSGGIAIVVASVLGVLALGFDGHPGVVSDNGLLGAMAGALIVAASGFADDVKSLSYRAKLTPQFVAAVIAILSGLVIDRIALPGIGVIELGWFGYVLTFVWLVGLTNAYNFMDGIDGLAGGAALLAGLFLSLAMIALRAIDAGAIALTLSAAALGFLIFNRPRARIFMGDVGSQFLGFAFAALGVALAKVDQSGALVFVAPLLLFHFLFDTVFTALRRWRRGENVTQAHRSHLYQRLTHSGFGHGRTTLVLCAMGLLQGLAVLWAAPFDDRLFWALAVALVVQIAYVYAVIRREHGS